MTILVTGGAGFIGSHTTVELIKAGYDVIIVDNFSNSSQKAVDGIEKICSVRPKLYVEDVCDRAAMERIFTENKIDAVIHFAGLKAVGESVTIPLKYYENNLMSSIVLLETMASFDCKHIVFSSSATVYGMNNTAPFDEGMPTSATNPYGWTKYMIEQIIRDTAVSDGDFSAVLLRYFNPIGAHRSGLIGENPKGIPNNLMPYIAKVASGELSELSVFGNDYDTPDGTGVRDYIHVVDLARGHLKALEYAVKNKGAVAVNLGTGRGTSVLELVNAFERVNGVKVKYRIAPRRSGDIATCFAGTERARELLSWEAELGIDDMCRDTWNFIKNYK